MKTDDPSSKDTAQTPGEEASPESPQTEEPLVSAAGAAKTANKAINETARKYLAAAGIKVDRKAFRTGFATGRFFIWRSRRAWVSWQAEAWRQNGVWRCSAWPDAGPPLKRPRTSAARCCGRRPEAPELPHRRLRHRE